MLADDSIKVVERGRFASQMKMAQQAIDGGPLGHHLAPEAERFPHGHQLSEVVGVVVRDEQDGAQVRLLPLPGRDQRKEIDAGVTHQLLKLSRSALKSAMLSSQAVALGGPGFSANSHPAT